MIKENFEEYEDGKAINEKETATVVAYCDDTVIFQDDNGGVFFLTVETPEAFGIGTVEGISNLQLFADADQLLKEKIHEVLKGGK